MSISVSASINQIRINGYRYIFIRSHYAQSFASRTHAPVRVCVLVGNLAWLCESSSAAPLGLSFDLLIKSSWYMFWQEHGNEHKIKLKTILLIFQVSLRSQLIYGPTTHEIICLHTYAMNYLCKMSIRRQYILNLWTINMHEVGIKVIGSHSQWGNIYGIIG